MHTIKLSQEHWTLPLAELRAVLDSCYSGKRVQLKISENIVQLTGLEDIEQLKKRLAYAMEIDGKEVSQGFDARYAKNRPFSHPTTLDPKLARCMVNLARPVKGRRGSGAPGLRDELAIFDPFCGTGGILLEAGLMGFRTIGIDIDEKMIEGCRKNLKHYEVKNFDISVDDFFKTRKHGVIVTDPPYGKSTSLPGKNNVRASQLVTEQVLKQMKSAKLQHIEEFYNLILERLHSVMKKGKLSCIGSPSTINLSELARNQGFKINEEHIFYVNKDMSKRICVLQK